MILPLWEDAIKIWDTKRHPELEQRKQLLYEWLVWMREADVLVPPFTDLPIKFERTSAPPVDIEAYTTETIVKAIEVKLQAQTRMQLESGRLGGGTVLDTFQDGQPYDVDCNDEYEGWFSEAEEGEKAPVDDLCFSEKTSSSTLKAVDVSEVVGAQDRLKAGVRSEVFSEFNQEGGNIEVMECWTFTTEEKDELYAFIN